MIYALAFFSMTILDVAWVGYNRSTAQGNRAHARLWAVLLVALGGLNTLAIVETPWALIATAAGAFVGTDIGLRLAKWIERDESEPLEPPIMCSPGTVVCAVDSPNGVDIGGLVTVRLSPDGSMWVVDHETLSGPVAEAENTDRAPALALAINDVAAEIMSARSKWPAFNSAHEGYAVALEKVDELWGHVKRKQKDRDLDAMRREAIQASAMFAAFAAECCGEKSGRV